MKSIFNRLTAVICVLGLVCACFAATASAAGSATAAMSASPSSVDIGGSVSVTLRVSSTTVAGVVGTVTYDASKLQYTGSDGNANGTSGSIRVLMDADSKVSSLSIKLNFKALAAGKSNVSFAPSEVIDYDMAELSCPSASTGVTVNSPASLSGNADLSALKVSSGTLTPAFSANTTSYSVTVANNVTTLTVSATTADKDAKVTVSGSKKLSVGKNTRSVKVTAPNGTTKTYKINITRLAADGATPSVDNPSREPTASSDEPVIDEPGNIISVYVGDEKMTVVEDFEGIELPAGFSEDITKINDREILCVKNKAGIVLVCLSNGTDKAFFIYDRENVNFTGFATIEIAGVTYILLDKPRNRAVPSGFSAAELTIGNSTLTAWKSDDKKYADFYLIYVCGPADYAGFYLYDSAEGTAQRFIDLSLGKAVDNTPAPYEIKPGFSGMALYVIIGLAVVAAALAVALIIVVVKRGNGAPPPQYGAGNGEDSEANAPDGQPQKPSRKSKKKRRHSADDDLGEPIEPIALDGITFDFDPPAANKTGAENNDDE